jgi:formyl-CoA transferase
VAFACSTQRMFERLAAAMGRTDLLSDASFKDMPSRLQNRERVDALVQNWVSQYDSQEVIRRLEEAEVPVGPLNSVKDLLQNPQVRAREDILEIQDPIVGGVKTPGSIREPAPSFPGQHNEEIYGGLLGLSSEEITDLKCRQII